MGVLIKKQPETPPTISDNTQNGEYGLQEQSYEDFVSESQKSTMIGKHKPDLLLILVKSESPTQEVKEVKHTYFSFKEHKCFDKLEISQVLIGFNKMYIRYTDGIPEFGTEDSSAVWGEVEFTYNESQAANPEPTLKKGHIEKVTYSTRTKSHIVYFRKNKRKILNESFADVPQNKLFDSLTNPQVLAMYKAEVDAIERYITEQDELLATELTNACKSKPMQYLKGQSVKKRKKKQIYEQWPEETPLSQQVR